LHFYKSRVGLVEVQGGVDERVPALPSDGLL
jgi:hypothetical protein